MGGNIIQKYGKELSRKWFHIGAGTILWIGSYYLFGSGFHVALVSVLFTLVSSVLEELGLLSDKRDDINLNNDKSTFLQGYGFFIMAVTTITNPTYMLHYGLAVFTLGFGDAFAALVGIKYGKYGMKLPHGKSLIGSVAFILAALIGMLIPCFIMGYGLSLLPQLLILATIGSIIEVIAGDWDNLIVQLIVGVIAISII